MAKIEWLRERKHVPLLTAEEAQAHARRVSVKIEVVVVGSDGVWGKGSSLDEAKARARAAGNLGKSIIIAVAPADAKVSVSGVGSLCWYGDTMPFYVLKPDGTKVWSARPSKGQTAAVDAMVERVRVAASTA